jgi:hypothetical protein
MPILDGDRTRKTRWNTQTSHNPGSKTPMPTRNEKLFETFKDVDLPQRVFYTLTDDATLQAHRTSKLLGLLVNHLREKGIVSDEELDAILLECIH